ncbi:MAG: hypothetical protein U0165_13130 [Polyangiaceae bacterium]
MGLIVDTTLHGTQGRDLAIIDFGIGADARLGAGALETAKASFAGRREVFVIVESGLRRIATALRVTSVMPR